MDVHTDHLASQIKAGKLTFEEIEEFINKNFGKRTQEEYKKEIFEILNKYFSLVSKYECIKFNETIQIQSTDIKGEIQSSIDRIKNIISYYYKGDIFASYNSIRRYWFSKKDNKGEANHISLYEMKDGDISYRIRNNEILPFAKEDLFHIPFQKRDKVSNQRYSVIGYPCLYLAHSVYCCWQEYNMPPIENITAVKFVYKNNSTQNKNFKLMDLRLKHSFNDKTELISYLIRLPLILVSSIKTKTPNETFKPEYIVPQLLLHSIVKGGNNNCFNGIIYTSTRYEGKQNEIIQEELMENIVIPVIKAKDNGFCEALCQHFELSTPSAIKNWLVSHPLIKLQTEIKDTSYSTTLFGMLEKEMKTLPTECINNEKKSTKKHKK